MNETRHSADDGLRAHFEIVQTDAEQPWFARLFAGNDEETWRTSENYEERGGALNAIRSLIVATSVVMNGGGLVAIDQGFAPTDYPFFTVDGMTASPHIVDVDERGVAA